MSPGVAGWVPGSQRFNGPWEACAREAARPLRPATLEQHGPRAANHRDASGPPAAQGRQLVLDLDDTAVP
jgi:hypothetical protein